MLSEPRPAPALGPRSPWPAVVLLLLLAAVMQTAGIRRAVVPAQDCVRYLAQAQWTARHGLCETLAARPSLGYPLTICLVQHLIRPVAGESSWRLAAQVAAAAAAVLAMVPIFFLLRRWQGHRAAVLGTAVLCCLPQVARLGADAVRDGWFLLLFSTAAWAVYAAEDGLADRNTSDRRPTARATKGMLPLLAGAFLVLAAGVRTEGLLLVPALVLTGALHAAGPRASRARQLLNTLALGLAGGLLVAAPLNLAAALGSRTSAAAAAAVIESPLVLNFHQQRLPEPLAEARTLPTKDTTVTSRFAGASAAVLHLVKETFSLLHAALLAALWGWWRSCRRQKRPGDTLAVVFCGLYLTAAVSAASQAGYLSARHLLPVSVFAAGWIGAACVAAGGRLRRALRRRTAACSSAAWRMALRWSPAVGLLLCMTPQLVEPLHGSRLAHRQAALWLAQHAGGDQTVLDTRGYSGLYTRRPTYTAPATPWALSDRQLAWLVLQRDEILRPSPRGAALRHLLEQSAEPAAVFAGPNPARDVLVYRFHPPSPTPAATFPPRDNRVSLR